MVELAGIVILGIIAQWVAWRLKLPAILPLILIGLLVGPLSTLYTEDGSKLIEPIWNGEKGLFPGETLYYFVSLAISIILFEGGLTLKKAEIANVGPVITKLITLGSVITFFGAGIAAHYIFGLTWQISFLFAALIIVTGPTVITPILRNIPLKKDVSAILKWEGILIDPIGALVAVLVFEFISVGEGSGYTQTALIEFGKIVLFGTTFGFTFAHALAFAIKKKMIPHYLLNVVSLSVVLLVFVESDVFAHESGLLAVVVMGMVLGNMNLPNLKELLDFKESLSVLLISILFILLAANINLSDLVLVQNWKTALLFGIVVFIIRPLGVLLSSQGSNLKWNEKLFIGWVGPRGIVAAGIASLFGSKLLVKGEPGAEYITPLVFVIVLGTVLLNATTARMVAKWVGVMLRVSKGILIVGASEPSRLIAKYLQNNGRHVVLLDNNPAHIEKATQDGLEALETNIFTDTLQDNIELNDVGFLFGFTGNNDINNYVINTLGKDFGEHGTYRLMSGQELLQQRPNSENHLFSTDFDFNRLVEVTHRFPEIHETDLTDWESLDKMKNGNRLPLFLKEPKGELYVFDGQAESVFKDFEGTMQLVYLGEKMQ
jgi:NhaP-type Na+/H+ or K+/H+ antiporter